MGAIIIMLAAIFITLFTINVLVLPPPVKSAEDAYVRSAEEAQAPHAPIRPGWPALPCM